VWERWDSYTKEHGFEGSSGKQNASMNSFSHYAFGAVMEWAYRVLAGIETDGPGYRRIAIRPRPPTPGSNPDVAPINWVRAHYDSMHGRIASAWRREAGRFSLEVTIPPNTSASVWLPVAATAGITEGGAPLARGAGIRSFAVQDEAVRVEVAAGTYRFEAPLAQ
jgi:alpha-L-rhamnosidase